MLCACIKEEECQKLLSSTCFNVCLISVWFTCAACVHPPVTHVTACNIHAGPQRHRAWLRPGLGFSCSLCVVVLRRSSRLLSDQRSGGWGPAPCRERGSVYVGRLSSTAAHAPACLDKQKYDPCCANTNKLKQYEGKRVSGVLEQVLTFKLKLRLIIDL